MIEGASVDEKVIQKLVFRPVADFELDPGARVLRGELDTEREAELMKAISF